MAEAFCCEYLGDNRYLVTASENSRRGSVNNVCVWDRPYVDEVCDVNEYWYDEGKTQMDVFGVVHANEGRRLLMATRPELIGKEYVVPDGVLTICDGAFGFC